KVLGECVHVEDLTLGIHSKHFDPVVVGVQQGEVVDRFGPGDVIAVDTTVKAGRAAAAGQKQNARLRLVSQPTHSEVAGVKMVVAGRDAVHAIGGVEQQGGPVPAQGIDRPRVVGTK